MKTVFLIVGALLIALLAFAGGWYVAGGGAPLESASVAGAAASGTAKADGAKSDAGDKAIGDKATGDKATGDKGSGDKGSGDKDKAAADGKDAAGAKEPKAPTTPPVPVVALGAEGGDKGAYSIELGAFRSLDNAMSFATVLQRRGLPVEIVETMDATGQLWRRVRAGRFADVWQAEARRPAFERIAGLGGVVVAVAPAVPAAAPAAAAKTASGNGSP